MSAPHQDDLIAYLYGEANAATRKAVEKRLANCEETRRQMEAWRATMASLDQWQIEEASPSQPSFWSAQGPAMLRMAAAVAILLGIGVIIGRHLSPTTPTIVQTTPASLPDGAQVEHLVAERVAASRAEMLETHGEIEEKLILASGAMTHRQVQRYLGEALQELESHETRNATLALFLPPAEQTRYEEKRAAFTQLAHGVAKESERRERFTRQIIERARQRAMRTH